MFPEQRKALWDLTSSELLDKQSLLSGMPHNEVLLRGSAEHSRSAHVCVQDCEGS